MIGILRGFLSPGGADAIGTISCTGLSLAADSALELARSRRGYAAAEHLRSTGWRTRYHGSLFNAMADLDEALAFRPAPDPLIAQVSARMEHTP